MTPDDLHQRLLALFGPVATDRRAAAALRVDPSTVRKWLRGDRKVPGPVIAYLESEDARRTWRQMARDLRRALARR